MLVGPFWFRPCMSIGGSGVTTTWSAPPRFGAPAGAWANAGAAIASAAADKDPIHHLDIITRPDVSAGGFAGIPDCIAKIRPARRGGVNRAARSSGREQDDAVLWRYGT